MACLANPHSCHSSPSLTPLTRFPAFGPHQHHLPPHICTTALTSVQAFTTIIHLLLYLPTTNCRLLEERAQPLISIMFSYHWPLMNALEGGSWTAILRANPASIQKESRNVLCWLVKKYIVSRRLALGRLLKLHLGAWKSYFWIISSMSPKGTTGQCIFERRESPLRRHSKQRSPSKEMISAYECVLSSALTFGGHRETELCLFFTKINIKQGVFCPHLLGNSLLGIDYFLSEHPPCYKVSTGCGYLLI